MRTCCFFYNHACFLNSLTYRCRKNWEDLETDQQTAASLLEWTAENFVVGKDKRWADLNKDELDHASKLNLTEGTWERSTHDHAPFYPNQDLDGELWQSAFALGLDEENFDRWTVDGPLTPMQRNVGDTRRTGVLLDAGEMGVAAESQDQVKPDIRRTASLLAVGETGGETQRSNPVTAAVVQLEKKELYMHAVRKRLAAEEGLDLGSIGTEILDLKNRIEKIDSQQAATQPQAAFSPGHERRKSQELPLRILTIDGLSHKMIPFTLFIPAPLFQLIGSVRSRWRHQGLGPRAGSAAY